MIDHIDFLLLFYFLLTLILGAQKNPLIEKTLFSTNYMSEMTGE